MINNTEQLFPTCSNKTAAAKCYVNAFIEDVEFNRAAAIINDRATPSLKETAQSVADIAKCSVQKC